MGKPKRKKFTIKISGHGEYVESGGTESLLEVVNTFFNTPVENWEKGKTVMELLREKLNSGTFTINSSGLKENRISFLSDAEEPDDGVDPFN